MFTIANSLTELKQDPYNKPEPVKDLDNLETAISTLRSAASLALGDISLNGVVRTYKAWTGLSYLPTKILIVAGSVLGGFVAYSLLTSIVAVAIPLVKIAGALAGGAAFANYYVECWNEKKTLELSFSALPEHLQEMWNAFTIENVRDNLENWQKMGIKHELGTVGALLGGFALTSILATGFFALVPRLLLCQMLTTDTAVFSFSLLQHAKPLVQKGVDNLEVELEKLVDPDRVEQKG